MRKFLFLLPVIGQMLYADLGYKLCNELDLVPSAKAKKQWEKLFSRADKLKRMQLDHLNEEERFALLEYLKDHAADSDSPTVPGM